MLSSGSEYPYYVYIVSKPDGTPFYVGKGSRKRCFDFKSNRSQHFKNVVAKHGAQNIRVSTYPAADEADAFELEIIFVDLLRWKGFPLVNLTKGGDGVRGYKFPADVVERIRIARLGKPLSPECRANMSAARKGKRCSAETKAKISAALTGNPKTREAGRLSGLSRKGKPLSPAHRTAIAAALRGKPRPSEVIEKIRATKRRRAAQ